MEKNGIYGDDKLTMFWFLFIDSITSFEVKGIFYKNQKNKERWETRQDMMSL